MAIDFIAGNRVVTDESYVALTLAQSSSRSVIKACIEYIGLLNGQVSTVAATGNIGLLSFIRVIPDDFFSQAYHGGSGIVIYFENDDQVNNSFKLAGGLVPEISSQNCLNNSGSIITKGQVIYLTGSDNTTQLLTIAAASASASSTAFCFGLALEDILNNASGPILSQGGYNGINTSAWDLNDVLYLSDTPGAISDTPGTNTVVVGRVTLDSTNGSILLVGAIPLGSGGGGSGATGIQGVTGIQGLTGLALGQTGIQGVTGLIGNTGIQGLLGIQGSTGILGNTGIQGITGLALGQTGIQGVTGLTGATGILGLIGSTGIQGLTGIQGETGIQGLTGVIGNTGIQGVTGFIGSTGIQGLTGLIGNTGIQGLTGVIGNTGIQGVTGFYGQTGILGQTGIQGTMSTIACEAYLNADQSIANDTVAAILFDVDRYDTSSIHSTASNQQRFTAPEDGIYLVNFSLYWAANSTGVRGVVLQQKDSGNNQLDQAAQFLNNTGTVSVINNITRPFDMNTGDYIDASGYQNSGGSLNAQTGAATNKAYTSLVFVKISPPP